MIIGEVLNKDLPFFKPGYLSITSNYLLDLPCRLLIINGMTKILISGTVLLATCASLLVLKRGRIFGRSSNHIMISFDQFKARELEKR